MTIRVVIADDDPDIRDLVAIAITRAGFVVIASESNGGDAVRAIREFRPDLAVLDVSMPVLTGLEVCRLVRHDPELSSTRLVLLSAAVDPQSSAAGREAGADKYLIKPFSPRRLADELALVAEERP